MAFCLLLLLVLSPPVHAEESAPAAADSAAEGTPAAADAAQAPPRAAEAAAEGPAAGAAEQVVGRLYDALLAVMQEGEALGQAGRARRLDPVIRDVFNLPFMAEKVLGRHWRALSTQEQQRWVDVFSRLTISTYAARFDRFEGQRFEVLGNEPAARETLMVQTHIVPAGEEAVAIDYRMLQTGGAWRIIDVHLRGTVSELALRRSEYSSVVKREGFESLVDSLEDRIENPVDETSAGGLGSD